ncbi:MAG: hypothetical protein PHH63_05055 [Bacteroidales bacterium]|nr:hypothetical protein [Bacteroidales bacterium]MDD3162125.1 hypothetical protein [Bacteroidales bacterium]
MQEKAKQHEAAGEGETAEEEENEPAKRRNVQNDEVAGEETKTVKRCSC